MGDGPLHLDWPERPGERFFVGGFSERWAAELFGGCACSAVFASKAAECRG